MNSKAPGFDNLPADFWKLKELSVTMTEWLATFFYAIIDFCHVPTNWTTIITVPIFKNKDNPTECSNYCPIPAS